MRQAPRSPLSFKLQRVANVPEHPPPPSRLMSCAHIANRQLSRIIGASGLALPLGNVLLDIPAQHHAIAQSGNDGVSSGSSVGQLLLDALDIKPSEFCVLIG